VLVACSGGADSLALAAALAFEAPRRGLLAGAVTVDHGLQEGSARQAERVARALRVMGLDPVFAVRARVAPRGAHPGGRAPGALGGADLGGPLPVASRGAGDRYRGPEAEARKGRYAALDATVADCGATAILLGHTMDDQAETVLLGLARGSGARSMAGMAPAAGRYLRPLLGLRRAQTMAACAALGLDPWDDPQNADQAYARTRVRERILPLMEELIGPGVAEALARTADQLRADADVLDGLTATHADRLMRDWPERAGPLDGAGALDMGCRALDVGSVAALPAAIRTRLLRRAAIAAGAPAGSLTARHLAGLDALVMDWHGQRWIDLPGGLRCQRRAGRLQFTARS